MAWCKRGTRTPRTLDLGTRDPPQSLKVGPGTPLKFKSGTPGPLAKFINWTPGPPTPKGCSWVGIYTISTLLCVTIVWQKHCFLPSIGQLAIANFYLPNTFSNGTKE